MAEVEEDTLSFISKIRLNIERRKTEIESDGRSLVLVENRLISPSLSAIPGIEKSLRQMRMAKQLTDQEITNDAYSHATQTKGELRRRNVQGLV